MRWTIPEGVKRRYRALIKAISLAEGPRPVLVIPKKHTKLDDDWGSYFWSWDLIHVKRTPANTMAIAVRAKVIYGGWDNQQCTEKIITLFAMWDPIKEVYRTSPPSQCKQTFMAELALGAIPTLSSGGRGYEYVDVAEFHIRSQGDYL